MSSRFDRYFERDFFTGEEFVERFGVDEEHIFHIGGFDMRDSYDQESGKTIPKPVLYLAELAKPIFLNRTSHEALVIRFGKGYDAMPTVIGQRITMVGRVKQAGRTRMSWGEVMPHRHPDMHAPIGEKVAQRWLAKVTELKGSVQDFLRWLQPRAGRLHEHLLTCSQPAEWPNGAMPRMAEYLDDPQRAQGAAAAKPAAGAKREGPTLDRSTAQPPAEEITEDDIPF